MFFNFLKKGKTESLTPLKKWLALRQGDFVRMRRSGTRRLILAKRNGCITLAKIQRTGYRRQTTVYVPCDRHFFII